MKRFTLIMSFCLLVFACGPGKKITEIPKDDGILKFTFVQLNDVYEIAPLGGGAYGGMARVAHVVDSMKRVQPNTYLFMAGDFLNPSLLGNMKYEGERILGRQMIEVMNAMDFELVTFGNHEFDIGEKALQKRLNESNFYWTSANCFQQGPAGPRSFYFQRDTDTIYVPETYSLTISDSDGTLAEVGLFSVTLNSNPQEFVYYSDVLIEAGSSYTTLQLSQVDLIMGLTHQEIEKDVELVEKFEEISFIMGGHEHYNMMVEAGHAKIAKADANAKTIYIHDFTFDKRRKYLKIDSRLFPIDARIAEKPEVKAIVDKWETILEEQIRLVIDEPHEVIYHATIPLDGTDSASRGIQTNLGEIITHAMALSFQDPVEAALVNGGSIRLDDMLSGAIESLDVFRVLPFGGEVVKVDLTGSLLKEVLDYGKLHRGEGAYLQRYNISQDPEGYWRLGLELIENEKVYQIAMSDFLLKGLDIPFLTPENKGIIKVYFPNIAEDAHDIRKAVIQYLKSINK